MVRKKLTAIERRRMLSAYRRREDQNYHTENAVVLIKRFGTKRQYTEAKKRQRIVGKQGYETVKQGNWFNRVGHKHFSKLIVVPKRKRKR